MEAGKISKKLYNKENNYFLTKEKCWGTFSPNRAELFRET